RVTPLRAATPAPTRGHQRTAPTESAAPAVATPRTQVPGARALAALQRLSWDDRGRHGLLPGGCATLAGDRICVPPVTLDGKRLSDIAVIAQLIDRQPGAAATHQAIAEAVFQRLLYLEGIRAGIRVTRAQA